MTRPPELAEKVAELLPATRTTRSEAVIQQRLTESGRRDSNPRPPGPKPGALPDCATPRYESARRQVAKLQS